MSTEAHIIVESVSQLQLAITGACPYCSASTNVVLHGGICPRVKAISYYPDGSIKRVELHPSSP